MLLTDFETIILSADPTATHYTGAGTEKYTVWAEYGDNSQYGGNKRRESATKIQVDRFTKIENDPVVGQITEALTQYDIAFEGPLTVTEPETGYIHHIWTCEAV